MDVSKFAVNYAYGNEFTTNTHKKLTDTKIKDKIEPYMMTLITITIMSFQHINSFLLSIIKRGRINILTLYTSKDFSTNACKLQEN